jgi:hypothetical protein
MLISSQYDIWVKSYDQNTGGRSDGLTERPDGQLQPPFQNSTGSFHNKATSRRCCPTVRMVALWLHVITIIRLWSVRTLKANIRTVELVHAIFIYEAWSSGPWRLTFGRLNLVCTFLPYRGHHPDGITHRPNGSIRLPITVSWGRNPNSCQRLNGVQTV